jgi:hypothetical protein
MVLTAAGCANCNLNSDEPKERVGVYDSRAVAIAYVRSEQFDRIMKAKMAEMEEAKTTGDTQKIEELEAWGSDHQAKVHRQGFGSAPVDNILEQIKDELAEITKEANVTVLVSKWDKKTLKKYKCAELIDVTDMIAALFCPDEKTLKTIEQMKEKKPIPGIVLEAMIKLENH